MVNQNPLVPTEDREIFHVHTELTVILNDYDEDRDEHDIILTEEEENGHRIVFSAPPATAAQFPLEARFHADIALERLS